MPNLRAELIKTIHATASCIAAICLTIMAFEDIRQTDIAKDTLSKMNSIQVWIHNHIEEQGAYRVRAEKFIEMYAKVKQGEAGK